jgi:hypothetical protein
MAQSWQHPKTGVLYFRFAIPEALRPFAKGGKSEPKHEYKRSLHTKDRRLAKRLYADASAVCADYVRKLEARRGGATHQAAFSPAPSSGTPTLEDATTDLRSLAGAFAGAFLEAYRGKPAPTFAFHDRRTIPPGAWGDPSEPWVRWRYRIALDQRAPVSTATQLEFIAQPAKGFLEARGVSVSAVEWGEFCEVARDALDTVLETLQRHARGEVPAVPVAERLAVSPAESRPKVSIKGLADVWARGNARPEVTLRTSSPVPSVVARPVPLTTPGTTVAPVTETDQLLRALDIQAARLGETAERAVKEGQQDEFKQGQLARTQSQLEFAQAVEQGVIPQSVNPWFIKG